MDEMEIGYDVLDCYYPPLRLEILNLQRLFGLRPRTACLVSLRLLLDATMTGPPAMPLRGSRPLLLPRRVRVVWLNQ